jgi:spermidine/putrescine transport system substrate-binding protein
MINKIFSSKFIARFLMVLFWLILIVAYIYLPLVYNFFRGSKKSINMYCWVDVVDKAVIKDFERDTGIKVNVSYYEHNYELISKLEITQGRDYDLIMATDFTIGYLKNMNLLKSIEHERLNFWNKLEPAILNREFDRSNKYSVPYLWDIYVIGFNKNFYKSGVPIKSWALIFNPRYMPKHVGMLEEANESFLIASQYLFNSVDNLTDEKLFAIRDLLRFQKSYVESYVELRASDLLTSGASPVVVAQSAYICRPMKFSDKISFFVPEEGSFVAIDSFVIPQSSDKTDFIYQFLNYIYQKKNIERVIDRFCYLPATRDLLSEKTYCVGSYDKIHNYLKNASLFRSDIPIEKINKLWMEVKSY